MAANDVVRFDVHQRIQHACVAASFIGLVVTGWPMKASESGISRAMVEAMGGAATVGSWHRFFGAVLILASVYHVVYLVALFRARLLPVGMIPLPKDFLDLRDNCLYLLGVSREKPRFGRYTYWEKFDYWAVFWGMAIMGGSGLILWFPVQASGVVPPWAVRLAQVIHSDEALLALLAIFIWHFYNGHFRPSTFPVNWVFITGRLPAELVREEYAGWWAEMNGEPEPEVPTGPAPRRLGRLLITGGIAGALLAAIALAAAFGPGIDRLYGHVPPEVRGETRLPARLPAPRTGPSAAPHLVDLKKVPLESVESATRLSCFKGCHSPERFVTEDFEHGAHAGKGLDCTDCHRYLAHAKAEVDESACRQCH